MQWRNHWDLEGKHAFLGASSYSWLNYDVKKLLLVYNNLKAKERGSRLHALAHDMITEGIKAQKSSATFNKYVNDAIGYKMQPEQVLYYSQRCFGTADAISFRNNLLRIHDLKTGATRASFKQLYIYAALFCLEYSIKPGNISIELRIYQNNEILIEKPEADDILPIMDMIVEFNKVLEHAETEE